MKDLYNFEHRWKLLDWIDENKLDWNSLSFNPRGLYLLEQNKNKINWESLSQNESAIYLLEKNQDKIIWNKLACNRSAITLLKKRIDYEKKCKKSILNYLTMGNQFYTDTAMFCVFLSCNRSAIPLLEENPEKINWHFLSANESAIDLLEKNYDKIDWDEICKNRGANRIFDNLLLSKEKLRKFINGMRPSNWDDLSSNPSAISILNKYPNKICWDCFSENPSAIHLLEKNPDKIDWYDLAGNPSGMDLLEKNLDKLKECSRDSLCSNPFAIKILEGIEDPESFVFNWSNLSSNVNAIHLLQKYKDRIDWRTFSKNPAIFELDYDFFRERMNLIREELMEKAWHPSRFQKWCLSIDG